MEAKAVDAGSPDAGSAQKGKIMNTNLF